MGTIRGIRVLRLFCETGLRLAVASSLLVSVSACDLPSKFKSVDQARGTLLVTAGLLTIGPTCETKVSYLRFDADKARTDEAEAAAYMRRHGITAAEVQSLRDRATEASLGLSAIGGEDSDALVTVCSTLWERPAFQHYKKVGASDELPPPVSIEQLATKDREQADQDREDAKLKSAADQASQEADAAANQAEAASRAADAAEQKAVGGMGRSHK